MSASVKLGRYPGRCTGERDVKFGRASTGTEQIGMLFEMTDGEHKGRTFTWYGSLGSEASVALVRGVLEACGWDGKSWTKLGPLDKAVVLEFKEDADDDGNPYTYLAYVNRIGVAMKDELDVKERARLLANLDRANGAPAR